MKTFKQYITEKPVKLSATLPYKGAKWEDFRGFENPSEKEIISALDSSKFREVRFLVDSKGKMWLWDASGALHDAVVLAQTGQKYVGDYAKGLISYLDVGSGDKLKIIIMNTRTVGTKMALKNKTLKALAKRINSKGDDRVFWTDT